MVGSAGVLKRVCGAEGVRKQPAAPAALGAAVLLLLLAALVLQNPLAGLWAKALVDPFFHGTSAGASLATLLFAAAACLRLATAPLQSSRRVDRAAAWVLIAALALGQAANLGSHVALMRSYELPITAAVYHWAGDTNTYSYLFHSHTGKAAMDLLVSGLLRHVAPSWDLGAGLAQALPWPVGAACAASLLAGVAAALLLLPSAWRQGGVAGGLMFGFCALSCLKSSIDGGPLTYHFIPAAAVLIWLLARIQGVSTRVLAGVAAAGVVVVLAYLVLWLTLATEPGTAACVGLAGTLAILGLLAGCTPADHRHGRLRRAGWWACTLLVATSLGASLLATPGCLLLPLDAHLQATVCPPDEAVCREEPVSGRSAYDVYRAAGDDPLKPRHTFIAPSANAGPVRMAAVVRVLRTQPGQGASAGPVRALPTGRLGASGNVVVELFGDRLPAVFGAEPHPWSSRNYYVFLHLAARALRAQGLQQFALSPLRHDGDARGFGLD